MDDQIEKRILALCFGVIKALAFLLVKNGIGYQALEETAKQAFVEAIRDNYGSQNRKANRQRVCAMSGLSPREVSRIVEATQAKEQSTETDWQRRKPAVVLSKWYADPGFLDDFAQPMAVNFEGKGYTFTRLVKEAGISTLSPTAMLNELMRVGCVIEEDGKYRAVSASYIPTTDNPERISVGADALRQMTWTVVQNLVTPDQAEWFYQRRVIFDDLPKQDRAGLRRRSKVEGQALLERLNDWATAKEYTSRKQRGRELKRKEKKIPTVGMGVYYFDSTYEDQKKS